MNLRDIVNGIKIISNAYPTVQDFGEGDIYNYLNTGEHKYPCIFLTISNINTGDGDTNSLSGNLFYVDRLLNDSSNRINIQSVAISILKLVTDKIEDNIPCTINTNSYTPFTEQFSDWTAGAYCEFDLTYSVSSDCGEYDDIVLKINEDGIYDVSGYDRAEVTVSEDTASKEWVEYKLTGYAKKSEIPSLTGYATENWVESKNYLTEHQSLYGYATENWVESKNYLTDVPEGYATENWVNSKGYLTDVPEGYATESWVENKGYISVIPSSYATKNWVESKNYLTDVPEGYATENWVESKNYLTDVPEGYATQSWVENKNYLTDVPEGYATENWVESKNYLTDVPEGYATQSWVENKNYLTDVPEGYATETFVENKIDSKLAYYTTKEWVDNEIGIKLTGYAKETFVQSEDEKVKAWVESKNYLTEHQSLEGYATENWVESKNYLTEHQSLEGYATENWVESKNYLTSVPEEYAKKTDIPSLTDYATKTFVGTEDEKVKTWVENKNYLTQHQDISGKLDKSSVWSGTKEQWEALTDEQKASYIIALIK